MTIITHVLENQGKKASITIAVGDAPRTFAWNYAQNRTYVANHQGASILVIRDVVGIEEEQSRNLARLLRICPNPARTFFTIHSSAPIHAITIYDVLGKLVRRENLKKVENEVTIMLEGIIAGVYFLKVNTDDTEFLRKIIITK